MNIYWRKHRNYNETWSGNADIETVALYNLVDDPKEELNLAKNDTMAEKATEMMLFRDRKEKFKYFKIARMIGNVFEGGGAEKQTGASY